MAAPAEDSGAEARPTVLISGAGIAGLSLALFLSRSGKFEVRLFERAPELRPALGASFGLNGALECLDRAGLRSVWEPHYHGIHGIRFRWHRSPRGVDFDLQGLLAGTAFEGKNGMFMREELQGALAGVLPAGVLECGRELVGVHEHEGGVRVTFSGGGTAEGDILVAADGINSAVRRLVWGGDLCKVYSGMKMWWVVHEDAPPPELLNSATQLVSEQTMALAFSGGRKGRHLVAVVQRGLEPTQEELQRDSSPEFVHRVFTESGIYEAGLFAEEKLMSASRVLHLGLYSMPPGAASWSRGRVCLIGDAVHATTPFMGQGANQAVQSAFSLARLLEEHGVGDCQAVFRELHSIREPPTSQVITSSLRLADLRLPQKGEGCLMQLKRALFYMFTRFAPKFMGRQMVRAFEVRV